MGVPTLSYLPFAFANILSPIVSIVTAAWGGNIIYADGSRTGIFGGKVKKGPVDAAPEEAHAHALERLAELRANGTYKNIGE